MGNLDREFNQARQKLKRLGATDTFKGKLGATVGGQFRLYTNTLNQCYVTRSDTGGYEEVFNAIAPPEPGLEVICGRLYGNDYLEVVTFNFRTLASLGRKVGAVKHAAQHFMKVLFGVTPTAEQLGPDPVFVSLHQLTNLSVAPHQGMVAKALSGVYKLNGVLYGATGSLLDDLTAEIPTDPETMKLCLVEEDTAGDLHYTYSAEFASTTSLPLILFNAPGGTTGRKSRVLVLLITGMTGIGWQHLLPIASIADDGVSAPSVMIGADGTDPGTEGFVPAPDVTDNTKFLRGDATWADPPAPPDPVIVGQAVFTVSGTLAVGAGTIRIYNNFGEAKTITKVMIAAHTAPTGSAIIVDVNLNGTTIFSNQAHRPQIAASTNTGSTTDIDVDTWAADDYLSIDVDQIGSTAAGANLTIHVVYEA